MISKIPFLPWAGKAALEIEISADVEKNFRLRAALDIADLRGADLFGADKGIYMERGCFFGTLNEFAVQVEDTHGSNTHGDIYRATIKMIEAWADAQDGEST